MRNGQFERTKEVWQKEISHMFNGGARRDTVIRMLIAKVINANSTFTSAQLRVLFEMVL